METKLKQIWSYLFRDKTLCSVCKRNLYDSEYGMCYDCYYRSLIKTERRSDKN